jgi:hypothetical protein
MPHRELDRAAVVPLGFGVLADHPQHARQRALRLFFAHR